MRVHTPAVPPRLAGKMPALSVGAITPCPVTAGFRRDFRPVTTRFLRALSGSIMPASYRSDLSCPCSL